MAFSPHLLAYVSVLLQAKKVVKKKEKYIYLHRLMKLEDVFCGEFSY